jgi:alpha-L-rhamnosidase
MRRVDGNLFHRDWKVKFDHSKWSNATLQSHKVKMLPFMDPWTLYPRPIPALPEISRKFKGLTHFKGPVPFDSWTVMVSNARPVTIPANTTIVAEMEAESLTTGFLELTCCQGAGAKISILCSECYELDLKPNYHPCL